MESDSHPQRRAPRGHAPIPMTDDPSVRAMHINQLKERIERSAYTVDADAVAQALLRRPSARRTILPPRSRPRAAGPRAARPPPPAAEPVLVAGERTAPPRGAERDAGRARHHRAH